MENQPEQLEARSDLIVRAIFNHVSRITREYGVEELIRLNADFARDLVGADRCSLWLIDERKAELWTKVAHGIQPIRIPLGEGLVGACVKADAALVVNDAASDERMMRSVDKATGYHTTQVMCTPLRVEGRPIGVLQLLNKRGGFTSQDEELSTLVAHFAAGVIDGERLRQEAIVAQMLRRELDLARDVQQRLLPMATSAPGLDCNALCRPARMIGGDYYDFLRLENGSFGFTLGDVSGKGISAAVVMASIQTLLRSLLARDAEDLASVITSLSQALYESSTEDRYSTLFCGVISPDRARLRYVNAGHVPPFLFRKGDQVERLDATGMPVGLLPRRTFDQKEVALATGDILVIVSDGIVESRNNAGKFWEEAAVEQAVRRNLNSHAHPDIPAVLCQEADAWAAGAEQFDDMTAMSIRILN